MQYIRLYSGKTLNVLLLYSIKMILEQFTIGVIDYLLPSQPSTYADQHLFEY